MSTINYRQTLTLRLDFCRWPFTYVTKDGDEKNYYKIPTDYYVTLGLSALYCSIVFCEAAFYLSFAIRYRNSPMSRTDTVGSSSAASILETRNKINTLMGRSNRSVKLQPSEKKASARKEIRAKSGNPGVKADRTPENNANSPIKIHPNVKAPKVNDNSLSNTTQSASASLLDTSRSRKKFQTKQN